MFANRIIDGKPICPMKNCGKPLAPDGSGSIGEFTPESMQRAFEGGLLAGAEGPVLFHKACGLEAMGE